ncbi:MAG: uracil-DNA glycosylase [Gammaproteobacteria bacterium]|nr:uracil-DNA glycosylase [Gammaproteobacteria bacterium]
MSLELMRSYYLEKMGIQTWELRHPPVLVDTPLSPDINDVGDESTIPDLADWEQLAAGVDQCRRCSLGGLRQRALVGSGAQQADCLIIGEAPNQEEEQQGYPFAGEVGSLLNEILFSMGWNRDAVYLTNIVKCSPGAGHDLDNEMIDCCRPYLERQIELLNPKVILLLGRVAAQSVLNSAAEMSQLRSKVHKLTLGKQAFSVVVSYHPNYLLHKPSQKRLVWQDLLLLQQQLN